MPLIIKNQIIYAGGIDNGNTNSVDITESEYIKLEKDGLVDPETTYYIIDGEYTENSESVGNMNIVKLTQAEYDALPESKNFDGILYAITDGECSGGGTSKPVELTKAQYEALGESVNTDGILYAITDGDELNAKNLYFDDTETQLGVNNVQDAIIEQNKKLSSSIEAIPNTTQIYNMSIINKKNGVVFCSFSLKALVALSSGTNIASIPNEFKLSTGIGFFTKIYDTNGKDLGSAWVTNTGKVQYYANDGTTKIPVNSVLYISFAYSV